MHLAWFTDTPDTCPFWEQRETLVLQCLECARLQPLCCRRLQILLLRFWLHVFLHLSFYAFLICGPTRWWDLLVNQILATNLGCKLRGALSWVLSTP